MGRGCEGLTSRIGHLAKATGRTLAALFLFVAVAGPACAACRDGVIDLRSADGAAGRFEIEVARTPEARAKGLMFREDLAESQGMLFLFDPPQPVAFWMKNTPLPLDLIFVDETGSVIRVTAMATPFSEDHLPSGGPVRAVLEINGGLAARYGFGEGSQVRHPEIDQRNAAWPCG